MLEQVLQQAYQAEVFEVASEATKIGFEANRIKSFVVEETRGAAVRVVKDGRLGFAASTDLRAADRLIANALESARYGETLPLRFPGPTSGPQVKIYDPDLAALPVERLIEVGQEIVELIVEVEPEIDLTFELERRVIRSTLRNSSGTEVTQEKTPLSLSLIAKRVRGDDVLVLFDYLNTAVWDASCRTFAENIAAKLRLARRSAELDPGRMPVLLSPMGATIIGLPLLAGLNGKNAFQGVSPMAGRVGEHLFDGRLSVVDDPTLDGRPGSGSHDDEGFPRRRHVFVDHGVLLGFIYDLRTAAQAGTEPTGNGQRGLFSPPSASFSNFILQGGDVPLAEILGGIEQGLLVDSPLGLGQGNVIGGDFSYNLSLAYRIERGEIVGRVKDVSVAGNIYQDLRHIEAISRESEWVYGGMRLPYVLLPNLNVSR